MKHNLKQVLFFSTLILLLATTTRLHEMKTRSLWEDEGWTLLLSNGNSPADIVQTMAYDQHPPLYFVLIHTWRDLTGESEFALRSLSAFFSLLSVAAMYRLGKVTFNPQTGLIAAAILAVWDFSIDVAQDARQYGLLTLLVILSCTFYFYALKKSTRWYRLAWFLSSVAMLYTQYMGGVVLVIQLLHMLLFARRRELFFYWIMICAAFLPWLPVFIRQNMVRWDYAIFYQSGLPNNTATFILVRDALVSRQFGVIIGLFLLGLVFIRYLPRPEMHWRPLSATFFLVAWTVIFIGLIVYLNESREILRIRIFTVVMPPILLLVAHGLDNLQPLPQRFLLGMLLVVNLATIDTRQNNPPWREVVHNVTAYHLPGEPVLMDIWVGDFSTRYYVDQQMDDAPWYSIRELRDSEKEHFLPTFLSIINQYDSLWLLRWNDEPVDYDGLLVEAGFQRTASPYIEHEGNQLYSHRYDRLTEARLAHFGDQMELVKAAIYNDEVVLWWTTRAPLPVDYSISIRLFDQNGALIGNMDKPPLVPTSAWQPGQILYDQHALPKNLAPGTYRVGVSVYWYVEPESPLRVQSDQAGVAQAGYALIGTIGDQ